MPYTVILFVTLLTFGGINALAESVALVRDSRVIAAQGYLGTLPVTVQPVSLNSDVTVVVLSDTLTVAEIVRVRREVSLALSATFLNAHVVRLIELSGGGSHVSEALRGTASMQAVLKRLLPGATPPASLTGLLTDLADKTAALPSDWSHAVLIGHFSVETLEDRESLAWLSGWIGDHYRHQHVRVSFWALDAVIPAWAQDLSQSTQGAAADTFSALLPALNNADPLFMATWQMALNAGAWPSVVTLMNEEGARVESLTSLCAAANFTPPAASYVAARAVMMRVASDETAARGVLAVNPADMDALRTLAKLYQQQRRSKEALAVLRQLSEINPADASVWAQLGVAAYYTESFDEADAALKKASASGIKSRSTLEIRSLLLLRQHDFAGATAMVDEALALASEDGSSDQSLLLLRADCAHGLKRWQVEAESLERATALGPVPLKRTTALIEGYLAADQFDRALNHLRTATPKLPNEAATQCRYASFWEQAHDDARAETLWKSAIAGSSHFEAAYAGLAASELRSHRNSEALQVADQGLAINPQSESLLLTKEQALEAGGDLYAARRLLMEHADASKSVEMLERRSQVEDWYGAGGADAYTALLIALDSNHEPLPRIVATCRRGLAVAIRDEKPQQAKAFATRLAVAGDQGGLALLSVRETAAVKQTELPGGVDAFYFLLFGKGQARPNRIFVDASRFLISAADTGGKSAWERTAQKVHEYFQRVAALAALGERKAGRIEIALTLSDKAGKQRTEKVFSILGLRLKHDKEGISIQSAEGKEQTKKQDTLAALAIDDQAIQDDLASGKTYVLELQMDSVPVFPGEELWQQAFYGSGKYPGGLAEALVTDQRIPRLYLALNSMDRVAADALLQTIGLRMLAERYSLPLSLFSSALAVRSGHAEVPGGRSAEGVWQSLTGKSPGRPVEFFQTLLSADDGRAMAYFYTLSQLDSLHQKFFTRSSERIKRFYSLFRDAPEMRRGGDTRLGNSGFIEFLRKIPLNDDGSVDFPGSPEVWMVAKGSKASGASVGKMTRKLKKSAAPDDEDEILIRLANTEYKTQNGAVSELANFIAVTQIDEQRDEPMNVDSALLLAQGYAEYRGLFPYFAELGDLETSDYQAAFALKAKLTGLDAALINVRAGELHSIVAMLGLVRESGLVPAAKVVTVYRKCMDRYLAASDGQAWTIASLSAVDDLSQLAAARSASRDRAVRLLLIGASASGRREKSYEQVLALQKVPSLDGLCSIRSALGKLNDDPHAMEEIKRQLGALPVIPLPKEWKASGEQKKYLAFFDTAAAQAVEARLAERLSKKKRNPAEVEKLGAQLMAELEPWAQLALTGRIYARFLDPSDMLVSEDTMLLRKHEFISLDPSSAKLEYFPTAALLISSEGSGSRFVGGLAAFSLVAGEARASANHVGASADPAFSKALLGSIRATDWRGLTPAGLLSFSASVRLAREWIVASATSDAMRDVLETETRGILSINRRNALLESLDRRDWQALWQSTSISDLHFIGDELLEQTPKELWGSPALKAMRTASQHTRELDLLGPVAPDLSGCGQPRLRRYEPYEEYQRHFLPGRLAQRLAELKLYLAWMSDSSAWEPEMLPDLSASAADYLLSKVQMHDMWDWEAVLEAFRGLKAEEIEALGQPR